MFSLFPFLLNRLKDQIFLQFPKGCGFSHFAGVADILFMLSAFMPSSDLTKTERTTEIAMHQAEQFDKRSVERVVRALFLPSGWAFCVMWW